MVTAHGTLYLHQQKRKVKSFLIHIHLQQFSLHFAKAILDILLFLMTRETRSSYPLGAHMVKLRWMEGNRSRCLKLIYVVSFHLKPKNLQPTLSKRNGLKTTFSQERGVKREYQATSLSSNSDNWLNHKANIQIEWWTKDMMQGHSYISQIIDYEVLRFTH